jgi:hypothetical protein
MNTNTSTAAPRARASDPGTSHAAAHHSHAFSGSHATRILTAVRLICGDGDGATAKDIAAVTGLTVVQIDRRLPELERHGHVQVAGDENARDLVRDGYRVWELP